jgi:hypothetical protein
MISFILFLTLQNKRPYFRVFFSFRDILDLFGMSFFFRKRRSWEEVVNREHHETGKRAHTRLDFWTTWWCPSSPSWVLLLQTLPLWNRLNLKPTIYIFSLRLLCDGVAKKQRIHNTDLKTARIGGDMLPKPLPVDPSPPSTSSPSSSWWSGSSSSLNYGIVEVTCIYFSRVLH